MDQQSMLFWTQSQTSPEIGKGSCDISISGNCNANAESGMNSETISTGDL
jgi:hypothetical protein